MKISEVKVKLLGSDVLSIINEFVKVEGLDLSSVTINDGIQLEGSFKKGFKVDFSIKAEILGCEDNKVKARLSKVKVFNFGIFRLIRSFVLKKIAKEFKEFGIDSQKNIVSIDNCVTRLRLEIKDHTAVNEKVIKSAGVAGIIRPSKTSIQVIVGTQVQFVADELKKLCKSKVNQ